MSILLEKMKEDVSYIEAKYWGLIFDICNAIKTDYEKYHSLMKTMDKYTLAVDMGDKKCVIDVSTFEDYLYFIIDINAEPVLWIELEYGEITDYGVDAAIGKCNIDMLEQVYTLL